MSSDSETGLDRDAGGTWLSLKVRHENCWTIEASERSEVDVFAHTMYPVADGRVRGRFTVVGPTVDTVDDCVESVRGSRLTASVVEAPPRNAGWGAEGGGARRTLFVEYDAAHSLGAAFASRGLIHDGPVRVSDGVEHWRVCGAADRARLLSALDEMRSEHGADIEVTAIGSPKAVAPASNLDALSPRQREVLELARRRNYYAWPREATTADLAAELGVTKPTALEHLRKAEAKLLGSGEGRPRRE